MSPTPSPEATVDLHLLKHLAIDAEVDFRTFARAIAGRRRVRALSARRIRRVLAARGLLHLLPDRVALGELRDVQGRPGGASACPEMPQPTAVEVVGGVRQA